MKILFLIALNFFVYYRTLRFGLVVDDINHKEHIERTPSIFVGPWYSQLRHRLYGAGTLAIWNKVEPRNEHFLSVAINALISSLIYIAFGSNDVSLWAAILYAVNPVNNQTSIWLNGRRYAVNILIVLAMLITPWAILLYPATALFQVSAVFAPILLGGYFWLIIPTLLLCGGLIETYRRRHAIAVSPEYKAYSLKRLAVIVKSFGFYFFKMLIPGKTLMYYPNLYFWGMTKEGNNDAYALNRDFIKGVLGLSLAVFGLFYFQGEIKLYWLFMVLAVAQWSNIITVTMTLADRCMSLPNVFMMFFVSYIAHQLLGANATILLVALGLYYFAKLEIVMEMYKNIESFYNYHLYHNPACISARTFKIIELIQNGDNFAALEEAKQGLRHNPKDFKMLFATAKCLYLINPIGNREQIETFLGEAEKNVYLGQELKLWDMCSRLRLSLNSVNQELAKT